MERAHEIVQHAIAEADLNAVVVSDVPAELAHSIDRHRDNLLQLASSLLAGGQSEDVVRSTIEQLLDSFRDELARTIMRLGDGE